jgi:diguanylate cyclase (GGDEF)-like protein
MPRRLPHIPRILSRTRAGKTFFTRFALASAVPLAIVGVVVTHRIETADAANAAADRTARASVLAQAIMTPPFVEPSDVGPVRRRALAHALARTRITRFHVVNAAGQTVYSWERRPRDEALSGHTGPAVDVPLRSSSSGGSVIAQVSIPMSRRTTARDIEIVVFAALLLVYLAVFQVAAWASRPLRAHAVVTAHQAGHDALTGLPNRMLFGDRVAEAVAAARESGHKVAVMIMDLDRFKEVNDTLGHHYGDALLQTTGERLVSAVGTAGMVARLGGDEFAVLLPKVSDASDAKVVARRVRAALEQPIVSDDLTLSVNASIGIALAPDHGEEVEALMQRADVAMYVAKTGHSGHEIYASEEDVHNPRRLALTNELSKAIADGDIALRFHPKMDTRTGEVAGVEVLARWEHHRFGVIAPDEFIPLAEHTGLIRPLTIHVIDRALHQCQMWRRSGLALTVAVNLSVRHLIDRELPEDIARLLRRRQLPASVLELEITESAIMANPRRTQEVLSRLREMGVALAIDDFGVGYSSLGHLRDLPVNHIKIDRSFVMGMDASESDANIVRATINLAQVLGLEVTAEGVETEAAFRRLAALGCDCIQGYWLTTPLPARDIPAWIHETRSRLRTVAASAVQSAVRTPGAAGVGATTHVELLEEARVRRIPARRAMTSDELSAAIDAARRADGAADLPESRAA